MDLSKVQWRNGALMLGLTHCKPFTPDPDFEFDAPGWVDLWEAEEEISRDPNSDESAEAQRQAEEWFSRPHPLHRSRETPPPPQALINMADMSPFSSPAMSKVSPGPRRSPATGSAMLGSAARITSARKGHARLTSPIAIHASLHSTPLKKSLAAAAAAAGVGAPALTPLKLLPESAGKARVVALRTPGSASKAALTSGAQRVFAPGAGAGHRIVFDTIDEAPSHGGSSASGAVSMFSPERKPRAQRVSVAYVPAPTTHVAAPLAATAAPLPNGRAVTDENAPANGNIVVPAAAGAVTKATRSRVVAGSKSGIVVPAGGGGGGGAVTGAALSRKRRSNDKGPAAAAAPAMVELDSELEAMLSRHNEQVAQTQAADDELAAVLSAHNKSLAQSQGIRSPSAAIAAGVRGAALTRKKSRATLAPSGVGGDLLGSGNKQPKKKARMAAGGGGASTARGSAEHHPPAFSASVSAASTARSLKKKSTGATAAPSLAASLNKSASNGALSSRSSASAATRKSVAPASFAAASASFSASTHRSPNPPSPASGAYTARGGARRTRSSTAAAAAASASLNSSMVTDSPVAAAVSMVDDDADADAADISFRVEDLLDPEELAASAAVAAPALPAPAAAAPAARARKSMGKALRLQQQRPDADEEDSMLDAMIALDEPLPVAAVPAPAPAASAPRRIQAAVNFTSAAAAAPHARGSRPATAVARKSVGHALANSRSGNIMTTAPAAAALAKPAKATAASSRPATAGSRAAAAGSKKPAAVSAVSSSAASLASSRHKYHSQSTAVQAASSLLSEDEELAALLSAHNASLRPKAAFVSRAGSAAQLRAWEAAHGRKWHELNSEERERANVQMVAAAM